MTIPLPARARLFHIGPPKTGTTALQAAGAATRNALLEHGVRYPGRGPSQRGAVAEFIGRQVTWLGAGYGGPPTPPKHWPRMMTEIEADEERRIWFGHEYAAGADDATVRRFAEAIGPRIELVITLRPFGSMLPSIWQETNKAGNTGGFEDWLVEVLGRGDVPASNPRFDRRHDHAALVRRWAEVVGTEHVTVVVLDREHPGFVFEAFEHLLDLPAGLLGDAAPPDAANRSLSLPEAELLRLTNATLREELSWEEYDRLIAHGAARRMLTARRPGTGEPRVRLPGWAAEEADRRAVRYVEQIGASGVRVVGELDRLLPTADGPASSTGDRGRPDDRDEPVLIPLDAAVAALTGLTSAALGRGPDFGPPPVPDVSPKPLPVRELAQTARLSLNHAARTRIRRLTRRVRRSH